MIMLNLDITDLINLEKNLVPAIHSSIDEHALALTSATHAHLIELANQKLHTRRQMFIDHLTIFPLRHNSMESGGTARVWVLNLDRKFRWIDDGMDEHEMIDDLLKSPKAKTSKDGSRYLSIPFDHSPGKGGPTTSTPASRTLVDTIKKELKTRGIPFGKIEKGPDGKPLLGTLHNVDITKEPVRTGNGPGQGWGPIGKVKQGFTGTPFLRGVRITQENVKDQKTGKTSVKRSIMTFRTVSSKHKGTGRWTHPGLEAKRMMEEAADWAAQQWKIVVGAAMVKSITKKL